jgi:2-succinyl-6-hydroxy-2,4-cyclohexadiene-1-carboxylate synthase
MKPVLLHGFTGSPASWDAIAAALPDGVIAPALLGHDAGPIAGTWLEEIDRVAAIVARAGAPAPLVGYSMGGRVALGLLARHPGIASRAILIGASPGIEDASERAVRRDDDERRARLLETEGVPAFVDAWEREPIFATQRALPADTRAKHRAIRLSHRAAGLAASLRALGQGSMPSLWHALERIEVPITLVVGSEDAKLRGIAARMAERLPRARICVVAACGHDVVLERPSELARIIARDASLGEEAA